MSIKISEIPYCLDSAELFAKVAEEPWSMFIDSAYPHISTQRYDILVARPVLTIETYGLETVINSSGNKRYSTLDPFLIVKEQLGKLKTNFSGLPFCGGALGYFSYDLARRLESLPNIAKKDIDMPDMAIGIYDWAVIVDHHLRKSWLSSYCCYPQTQKQWQELCLLFSKPTEINTQGFSLSGNINSNFSKEKYQKAFDSIKRYIREGDCYQVNLSQHFSTDFEGNIWDFYLELRKVNPAPYSAYINHPTGAILSSSPERFLQVFDNQIETKPIKGTVPRSIFSYEDKALAATLLESEKDRAENLMIVDLLRNDISKNCEFSSVKVPKLFSLESYATVHHLVSTVIGKLKSNVHVLDLLRDCFPGGSITGAPKLRAMEIIEELESYRRSIYCGVIAYIGFDGNMDSNICIRTIIYHNKYLFFNAGGGIVWDSKLDSEYQECFDKAAAIIKLSKKTVNGNVN